MIWIFLLTASVIKFFVDPMVYETTVEIQDSTARRIGVQNVYYVEFNCEIPYQELYYVESKDLIISRTSIFVRLIDMVNNDSLVDTLNREFSITSFKTAAREELIFIVQFGMFINEGTYKYLIDIVSGTNSGQKSGDISVKKTDYAMSDILLASNIQQDTTRGYLCKGSWKVVPRPSHTFKERDENLYIYYEIYRPDSTEKKLSVSYSITDSTGKLVRKMSQSFEKIPGARPVNAGMNIQSLANGRYLLNVTVLDSSTMLVSEKEIPFTIARKKVESVDFEGYPYYEEIEYFVSTNEYKNFKTLDKDGKRHYLRKFWTTHNYLGVADRYEYTEKHFAEGNKVGHKTDRGRIYIKYGEPDEIEEATIELQESRPFKQWSYYNGTIFIFVDVRGTNEYVLVWTNVQGERSQPALYDYLPASKRREFDLE